MQDIPGLFDISIGFMDKLNNEISLKTPSTHFLGSESISIQSI